jgi:hypothetical protein
LYPVILTSTQPGEPDCGDLFSDGDPTHLAYVVYLPGVSSPSTHTTEIWLECMRRRSRLMLEDDCVLILDVATWHVSADAKAFFAQAALDVRHIPAAAGKWLNPCDQSIHREMRRTFIRLQREQPHTKLRNIIAAFYAVSDSNVEHSWDHTALLKDNYEERLRHIAAEGFRAGCGREEEFERAHLAWSEWVSQHFRSPTDALPSHHPEQLDDCALDGARVVNYGR